MECEPRLRLELDRELSLDGYTASGINKSFFLEMLFPIIHSLEASFDAKKHVDEASGSGWGNHLASDAVEGEERAGPRLQPRHEA